MMFFLINTYLVQYRILNDKLEMWPFEDIDN